jgi:uncharacterized membrane protein YeaQ/YmgE (transglycosylase-associated protein family)
LFWGRLQWEFSQRSSLARSPWLAGKIVHGAGFGLIGNIVVGIIGALVASWILPQLHIQLATGTVGAIVDATIGAVIVLVILSLIKRV